MNHTDYKITDKRDILGVLRRGDIIFYKQGNLVSKVGQSFAMALQGSLVGANSGISHAEYSGG